MIFKSCLFMSRRLFRNYIGMTILLLLPIALITVLGLIAGNAVNEQLGIPIKDEIAVTMILAFLMFGGFVTMDYVQGDLMTPMRWRMYSLPYSPHKHAYSILISSVLYNVIQSLLIVIYTLVFYDVYWGNIGIVLIAILAISTVVQFIYINLILIVKKYKTAERLGTGFGLLCIMLGEVWFPLPDGDFFQFISTYSNPFSLGQNIVLATMTGENIGKGIISFIIVVITTIILSITGAYFGRRRLSYDGI